MSAIRRAAILKLASAAYEMKLDVMNGMVSQDSNGCWQIGGHNLTDWLAAHEGQEIVLVMGALDDDRPVEVRTCRTCGRDYTDIECPYCRANRIRLRGRA
ncbi:MAG: hypothetical protein H6667_17370 [Ardenticatenaceae bacterium]|nr:hypothetical protein [Ardenticatenaceae bacterium]MCB9443224.1 hypothetical protein [Ardenticatenaceae bacterium]